MNITAAAALAALILAGAPALASAAPAQANPIQLNNVKISQSYGVYNQFEPGAVSVSFTNRSAVAATGVVFNLVDGNGTILAQYNDVGSYPQDATIRHNFEDTHLDNGQKLVVGLVKFADGTSWSAPSPAATDDTTFPAE
jgi:hypothetical protein